MIQAEERVRWAAPDAPLRRFVLRRVQPAADAEDVLQEIYLRIQRSLALGAEPARFGPWVYRIAKNAIADHGRQRARRSRAVAPPEEPAADSPDAEVVGAAAAELASYLPPFIHALPSPYREALILTELDGLTQRQAADALGVSWSGMKSRVQRGRAMLRASLLACCTVALDARGAITDFEPRPDGRLPGSCCASEPPLAALGGEAQPSVGRCGAALKPSSAGDTG